MTPEACDPTAVVAAEGGRGAWGPARRPQPSLRVKDHGSPSASPRRPPNSQLHDTLPVSVWRRHFFWVRRSRVPSGSHSPRTEEGRGPRSAGVPSRLPPSVTPLSPARWNQRGCYGSRCPGTSRTGSWSRASKGGVSSSRRPMSFYLASSRSNL